MRLNLGLDPRLQQFVDAVRGSFERRGAKRVDGLFHEHVTDSRSQVLVHCSKSVPTLRPNVMLARLAVYGICGERTRSIRHKANDSDEQQTRRS